MVFNDTTSAKAGICNDIDFLINTDDTSYPLVAKARNVNRRLDEVVSIILNSDGRWEWDDTNNTDLPVGTATLVDNQQDYAISGATFLEITRVEIKDANGNYYLLTPITQHEVTNQALSEFQKTAGRPIYYDKLGDSIFLYPKPASSAVTLAAGLKVYFQRNASYFVSTDTTKVPGFAAPFHRILSYGGALDYAIQNELMGKINILTPLILTMEKGLIEFYSSRSRDESVRATLRKEDYGTGDGLGNYQNSDRVAYY